ncbi:MAG: hypothetical protein RSB90_11380, partial [Eubacterium sp.]
MNEKKIKIGIITHYYKSNNLGGLLQAYAMQKCLDKMQYNAKQIAYSLSYSKPLKKQKKNIR